MRISIELCLFNSGEVLTGFVQLFSVTRLQLLDFTRTDFSHKNWLHTRTGSRQIECVPIWTVLPISKSNWFRNAKCDLISQLQFTARLATLSGQDRERIRPVNWIRCLTLTVASAVDLLYWLHCYIVHNVDSTLNKTLHLYHSLQHMQIRQCRSSTLQKLAKAYRSLQKLLNAVLFIALEDSLTIRRLLPSTCVRACRSTSLTWRAKFNSSVLVIRMLCSGKPDEVNLN